MFTVTASGRSAAPAARTPRRPSGPRDGLGAALAHEAEPAPEREIGRGRDDTALRERHHLPARDDAAERHRGRPLARRAAAGEQALEQAAEPILEGRLERLQRAPEGRVDEGLAERGEHAVELLAGGDALGECAAQRRAEPLGELVEALQLALARGVAGIEVGSVVGHVSLRPGKRA
jgi:hypothetical protein